MRRILLRMELWVMRTPLAVGRSGDANCVNLRTLVHPRPSVFGFRAHLIGKPGTAGTPLPGLSVNSPK